MSVGFRFLPLLIGAVAFLGLARAQAGEPSCLSTLKSQYPGFYPLAFDNAGFWQGQGNAFFNAICGECATISKGAQRAKCMEDKLQEAVISSGSAKKSVKTLYEDELARLVRSGLDETKRLPQDKAAADAMVADVLEDVTKECPGLKWADLKAASSQGFTEWAGARSCAVRKLCGESSSCAKMLDLTSIGLTGGAFAAYQTHAAAEALKYGQTKPPPKQYVTFEDDVIEVEPPTGSKAPPPKPYNVSAEQTHGVTYDVFRQLSQQGEARVGQQDEATQAAVHQQMGCPDNTEFKFSGDVTVCGRLKDEALHPIVNKTMNDMKPVLTRMIYQDLTKFAIEQVWQSYTVALLMDPHFQPEDCSSRAKARESLEKQMVGDAYMANSSNGIVTPTLNKCFATLRLGDRIGDLAETVCKRKPGAKPAGGSCASDEEDYNDSGLSRERHIEAYGRRVKDLDQLRRRLVTLNKGAFKAGGRSVTCSGQEWGNSCEAFFKKMESCKPDFRLVSGCLPPDSLNEELALAWSSYSNLKNTENYILTKYPELDATVADVDSKGKITYMPAWESAYKKMAAGCASLDSACPQTSVKKKSVQENFDLATRLSREKKLDLIARQACKNPENPDDFAKKLLISNPKLVNDFMKQADSPDIGLLLCMGLSEAQADVRSSQKWKAAAQALVMVLSAAAAIPSGGASIALGVAATAGAVGMTAYDIKQAYERASLEAGLHHGCIGDYNRRKQAEDALEDAMIHAAIDLGVGVGIFAGMSAVEKIAELRRLSKVAKGMEGAAPEWAATVNTASRELKGLQAAERSAITEEYGLADLGMVKKATGKLTSEGAKTVDAIQELEGMGFSKSAIQDMIKKAGSCAL